ncbi:hypothetical protein, partial [uncultured Duncaniella sp.]
GSIQPGLRGHPSLGFPISDQLIYLNCADFCELRVRDIKLERGNIASDWTPAPEDFMEIGGGNLLVDRLLQICAISPESANANNNNSN